MFLVSTLPANSTARPTGLVDSPKVLDEFNFATHNPHLIFVSPGMASVCRALASGRTHNTALWWNVCTWQTAEIQWEIWGWQENSVRRLGKSQCWRDPQFMLTASLLDGGLFNPECVSVPLVNWLSGCVLRSVDSKLCLLKFPTKSSKPHDKETSHRRFYHALMSLCLCHNR